MDRTNKRYVETKTTKGIKDSGDTKKPVFDIINNDLLPPDRGDSNQKPAQQLVNDKKKSNEKHNINIIPANFQKNDTSLKKIDKAKEVKILDAREKKNIREKYTLKLRSLNHVNSEVSKWDEAGKFDVQNAEKIVKKQLNINMDTTHGKESNSDNSKNSGKSGPKPERETTKRKPVIKTITSKNDTTRIFKAVTFVDQKKSPTPIKINIPSEVKKHSKTILTVKPKIKSTVSRVSVNEKPVMKKTGKRRIRHVTSPDTGAVRIRSPPTEVAKWAPTSINRHTKPYYEAWVDTTLTAISKNFKQDQRFFDKQSIIKSFNRVLEERPSSPEIRYDKLTDETFTGRIKVRHR